MSKTRRKKARQLINKLRYEIKQGKFGAYFYDNETKRDMTLAEICDEANKVDELIDEIVRQQYNIKSMKTTFEILNN
jgi:hypothetical protein